MKTKADLEARIVELTRQVDKLYARNTTLIAALNDAHDWLQGDVEACLNPRKTTEIDSETIIARIDGIRTALAAAGVE